MITSASKYASVRAEAERPIRRQASTLITTPGSTAPQVMVRPKPGAFVGLEEWFWRELREGGVLQRYLAKEVYQHKDRVRAIGKQYQDFKQNGKSDLELMAAVPARDYHRWRAVDQHFWSDRGNLRSLKRDNPEMTIFA